MQDAAVSRFPIGDTAARSVVELPASYDVARSSGSVTFAAAPTAVATLSASGRWDAHSAALERGWHSGVAALRYALGAPGGRSGCVVSIGDAPGVWVRRCGVYACPDAPPGGRKPDAVGIRSGRAASRERPAMHASLRWLMSSDVRAAPRDAAPIRGPVAPRARDERHGCYAAWARGDGRAECR